MLIAGATALFVPHAGRVPSKSRHQSAPRSAIATLPAAMVAVSTHFRLPPELAYEHLIHEAAAAYGLDAALIRAVIRTESAFDPLAVSSAGAQGLMQLMPALAQELGVRDPFDPRENIMAGVRYLSSLLDAHNGDVQLALASYNAGPGTVERYHGVPPYPETRRYVKTITGLLNRGRSDTSAD